METLVKKLFIVFLFVVSECIAADSIHQKAIDDANQHLINAFNLYKQHKLVAASLEDLEIFKIKDLPDDVYSSAFLLLGNICLLNGQYDVAGLAYKRVLELKHAPELDKIAARHGIDLIGDIQTDLIQHRINRFITI